MISKSSKIISPASSIIALSLLILTLFMMGINSYAQAHESSQELTLPKPLSLSSIPSSDIASSTDHSSIPSPLSIPSSTETIASINEMNEQLRQAQIRATLLESSIADIQSRTLSAISKLKVLTLYIPDGQLKNELIKIIQILENSKQ